MLVLAPLVLGEENAWKEEANSKSCVICSRVRGGSAVKEFRGVGVIDADPDVVFDVLNDAESYAHFMPYMADARVLKREKNSAVLYQRLALPLISDRDYTIVSKHDRTDGADGPVHRLRWEAANQLGSRGQSRNCARQSLRWQLAARAERSKRHPRDLSSSTPIAAARCRPSSKTAAAASRFERSSMPCANR